MPHEVSGVALKYINCFSADLAGKPMTPTPEAAMEKAIDDCRSLRTESEQQASAIEAPDWPKPNTPERATVVAKLFDGIDETQRYVARMMSQSAGPLPSAPSHELHSDAQDH
jgi:acyl-CoA reductase-like NAD-dependent aldehyde dehydrogenase